MQVTVGPGNLILLNDKFSILLTEVDGVVQGWPIDNHELASIFVEHTVKPQMLSEHIVGLFSNENGLGFIADFPEQSIDVVTVSKRQTILLPRTVWATAPVNYVRFAAVDPELDPKERITLSTKIVPIAEHMPNTIGTFSICFGNAPLPSDPELVLEEFKTRPFTIDFNHSDFVVLAKRLASSSRFNVTHLTTGMS